jgi:ankyrin repeat protein
MDRHSLQNINYPQRYPLRRPLGEQETSCGLARPPICDGGDLRRPEMMCDPDRTMLADGRQEPWPDGLTDMELELMRDAAAAFDAAQAGDTGALRVLASGPAGADILAFADEQERTLAHEAAMAGHAAVLELLGGLAQVKRVRGTPATEDPVCSALFAPEQELGYTPAHVAAEQGHTECLLALCMAADALAAADPSSTPAQKPPCVLTASSVDGNTPLGLAAMAGHPATLAAALRRLQAHATNGGRMYCTIAHVRRPNGAGMSALQQAIVEGHGECVEELVRWAAALTPSAAEDQLFDAGATNELAEQYAHEHLAQGPPSNALGLLLMSGGECVTSGRFLFFLELVIGSGDTFGSDPAR